MAKKYRDGLFRDYFSDKRRLLGLCNLLTGEDATDPDEIEINTLDGVFFDKLKNDISCLFRGKFLVIIEHQSTINENMPLRILFYAAELLRQYADKYKEKIYLKQLLRLPAPQFFVFYNGKKKESAQREMRLSEAFVAPSSLELVVQLYNLNAGMNDDFVSHDVGLNHYCTFVNLVEKFSAEGMDKFHALSAAVKYCIEHGIMAEYLLLRKKELASMLALEYDPELDRKAWIEFGEEKGIKKGIKKGIEKGIEKGIQIGADKNRVEMIKSLLAVNTPIENLAKATGYTEEQILKLAEN